jgi:predicted transcriptional regulator
MPSIPTTRITTQAGILYDQFQRYYAMLEHIFYDVQDRIKCQANRLGFVVDKIAIDQDFS